jgi:hypothetical protein
MGEAKDIVGSPKDEYKPRSPISIKTDGSGVIARLTIVIDDLDRAIQVKQQDLTSEGHGLVPENHYKLGILKGADSLVRRARAMLQDYGLDLDEIGIKEDPQAVKGEEIEAHADLASAAEVDDEDGDEEDVCETCGKPIDDEGGCGCDDEDEGGN